MSKLRVNAFTLSIEGYGAGPHQDLEHPLGVGGERLHQWFVGTQTFHRLHGGEVPETWDPADVDEGFAVRSFRNVGAWILGRNMFGPLRGPWNGEDWKGWWGPNPPYHVPVFVLTHHPRAPLVMEGGTTFHFVTEGIHAALEQARQAAGGRDIRLGGGVATIREYLAAGLVDEMHLAISPVLLGQGEHLLSGIDLVQLGLRCTEHARSEKATHVVLSR